MTKYSDTIAYLNALGLEKELGTLVARKRIQKIVYLLKQFGASLPYGYAWYIYGPYSPELTRTLFDPSNEDLEAVPVLESRGLETVNELRNFLGQDLYSVESLELIASLVYLVKHARKADLKSKQDVIDYLISQKPQYTASQAAATFERIRASGRWDKYLSVLE